MGRVPHASSACSADELHRFFDEKVAGVRRATADALAPSFSSAPPGCSFAGFITLDVNDVIAAVRALTDKQCSLDPMPTSLLIEHLDLLAPFLVELFNRSLSLGVFPTSFKIAHITNCWRSLILIRSMSGHSLPADIQFVGSLQVAWTTCCPSTTRPSDCFQQLPELKSAYRAHHSTETAVLEVHGNILRAIECGDLALLTMFGLQHCRPYDFTSASKQYTSYDLQGSTLHWSRLIFMVAHNPSAAALPLLPLVLCCAASLRVQFVDRFSFFPIQLFFCNWSSIMVWIRISTPTIHRFMVSVGLATQPGSRLLSLISSCVCDVAWMQSNRLQLNPSKSDVLWCSSVRRQYLIPDMPLIVGVHPALPARNLGIYIDSNVSIQIHVAKTASSCFCALHQFRSIRRTVSKHVMLSVPCRRHGACKLQSVPNAAARLVFSGLKYDHVTPLLCDLHWLPWAHHVSYGCACLSVPTWSGTVLSVSRSSPRRRCNVKKCWL